MRSLCYILVVLFGVLASCNKPNPLRTYISKPAIDTVVYVSLPSVDDLTKLDATLSNNSNKPVTFYLTPKQYDFGSYAALLNSIVDSSDSDKQKADKILNFLFVFTDHSQSAMHERLPHDPLRLVNSFQSGLCDDRNTALSKLFAMAGLQARVYHLGGHVVSEVYYDSAWHMYDADWGTVFTANGEAQDVTYIGKHTDIIKLDDRYGYVVREWIAPAVLKRVYGSTGNNYVNEWFGNIVLNYKNELTLNPGDKLQIHSEKQFSKQMLRAMFGKYAVVDTRHWATLKRTINMEKDYHLHAEQSPYAITQVSISNAAANDKPVVVYYSYNDTTWIFKGLIGGGSGNITFAPTNANGEEVVFEYKLKLVSENGAPVNAQFVINNSVLFSGKILLNGEGFRLVPLRGDGVLSLQVDAMHY